VDDGTLHAKGPESPEGAACTGESKGLRSVDFVLESDGQNWEMKFQIAGPKNDDRIM
jgi:hypothetical protein